MRNCLVAVCCNQPTIFTKTVQSLMEIGWGDRIPYAKERHGFDHVSLAWFTGAPRVDMLRNQAIQAALNERQKHHDGNTGAVPFTHVLFLDADMVWPTDVVTKMLGHHDRGIVAGNYVLKGPPYAPVHLRDQFEEDGVNMFYRLKDFGSELIEVDVVGMGCTLVPLSAVDVIGERPWFEYDDDAERWPRVSEDVTFCLKAKAQGVPRLVDPTVRCGHVGAMVYDDRWHHRYQASMAASKDMGPSVSIAESG